MMPRCEGCGDPLESEAQEGDLCRTCHEDGIPGGAVMPITERGSSVPKEES